MITDWNYFLLEVLLPLLIAAVLGGLIGLERGGSNHDAGLRTHLVVCLGAASVMVLSRCLIDVGGYNTDISRLGAQVISGIGFLGVGSIIVNRNRVKGLTTAACTWATACLGLCTGIGYYFISVPLTVMMVTSLFLLRPVAARLENARTVKASLALTLSGREALENIYQILEENDITLSGIEMDNTQKPLEVEMAIVYPYDCEIDPVLIRLLRMDAVLKAKL